MAFFDIVERGFADPRLPISQTPNRPSVPVTQPGMPGIPGPRANPFAIPQEDIDFHTQLQAFMYGTRTVESGHDYSAIGPPTQWGTAKGAYQFLDSTWGGFAGYSRADAAPSHVQDQRAAQLMTEYYQRFGSWALVAISWHAGPDTARKIAEGGSLGNIGDGYMLTSDYAARVTGIMNEQLGTGTLRSPSGQFGTPGPDGLERNFNGALNQLLDAVEQQTGSRPTITSGFRTYAQQKGLWDNGPSGHPERARDPMWVANPDAGVGSLHQHGLAADLSFPSAAAQTATHNLAGQFGLEFPMGHEGWHIQPVQAREMAVAGHGVPGGGQNGQPPGAPGVVQPDPNADLGQIRINFESFGEDGGVQLFQQPLTDPRAIEEFARTNFGPFAAYLDHPEIGPIIRENARVQADPAILEGQLKNTNWWKTTQDSARQWDALRISDPASADALLQDRILEFQNLFGTLGVPVSDERMSVIAETSLRLGWSEAEVQRAAAQEVSQLPVQQIISNGEMGSMARDIQSLASDYMVNLSNETISKLVLGLINGTLSNEHITGNLQTHAAGQYPHLADRINAGELPWMMFEPHRQAIAGLIGEDPDSLDLMNDPDFRSVLQFVDPAGETRSMTIDETVRHTRGTGRFGNSTRGRQEGAQMVQGIVEEFGKVK